MPDRRGPAGRVIVLAGATSASAAAVAHALGGAGARVVAVGRDAARLSALAELPGVRAELCDLTDEDAVQDLAERVRAREGVVDGLLPLVGGWRGGGGLAGQSEADHRALEASFTALRLTSRAFDADLRSSTAGRLAIVSSPVVERPLAGGANYAAVKAACETWTRAVAQGYAKAAREAQHPLRSAATVLRTRTLDPNDLAAAACALWEIEANELNDCVCDLRSVVDARQ